jgi:hypothetical protein
MIGISSNEKRTSPSGSISSTNDSGCSISPASPSSLYVKIKINYLKDFDWKRNMCLYLGI